MELAVPGSTGMKHVLFLRKVAVDSKSLDSCTLCDRADARTGRTNLLLKRDSRFHDSSTGFFLLLSALVEFVFSCQLAFP